MQNFKNCIMCFKEIDARAKKCPHCTSLQTKYYNLENHPILLFGILGVMIVGLFGSILYDHFFVGPLKEKAINNLKANVSDISTKLEGDTLYIACIGDIQNKSEFQFKNIKYQVEFFSDKNELIDTFSATDEEIRVKPDALTSFRVRGIAQKDSNMYKRCEVKIADVCP